MGEVVATTLHFLISLSENTTVAAVPSTKAIYRQQYLHSTHGSHPALLVIQYMWKIGIHITLLYEHNVITVCIL